MGKSDLPFGSEFSPQQVSLTKLLEFANTHGGDWRVFESIVYKEYFESYTSSEYNKKKLANNTKLSMQAYGIIDGDAALTECGLELYRLRDDHVKLYRAFGKHILVNLNGMSVIQCVQDMDAAGERIDLISLRERLERDFGIHFPSGGKHASTMRLWLDKAGILLSKWRVDRSVLGTIMDSPIEEIESLISLSTEQRAFLRALVNLGGGAHKSNELAKLAQTTYGVQFNEKNLPKQVLYPLEQSGLIKLTRGTGQDGRGAKPFIVEGTSTFEITVLNPLLDQIEQQINPALRPMLRTPLAEILSSVKSNDNHIKGLALEALAIRIMRLIDLTYVATRLRGDETGGAEVDVIFDSSRLMFSRWQVQCKNAERVSLDAVAKEVGLTYMLKSNAIVIITTGEVGSEARRYANRVMKDTNLCIIMIESGDIRKISLNPTEIVNVLNREAQHAMDIKKIEV